MTDYNKINDGDELREEIIDERGGIYPNILVAGEFDTETYENIDEYHENVFTEEDDFYKVGIVLIPDAVSTDVEETLFENGYFGAPMIVAGMPREDRIEDSEEEWLRTFDLMTGMGDELERSVSDDFETVDEVGNADVDTTYIVAEARKVRDFTVHENDSDSDDDEGPGSAAAAQTGRPPGGAAGAAETKKRKPEDEEKREKRLVHPKR
jgi:hypothetical protein